ESVLSSRTRCSLCCSFGSRSRTRVVMYRIFATMVSREARNGDSAAPTFSRFAGTATVASSLLISLTSRVFSATSCIRRSLSADAWDRLSILACASGEGPCLQPAAMSRARGSHAAPAARRLYLNMFRNLLPENWGDLRHTGWLSGREQPRDGHCYPAERDVVSPQGTVFPESIATHILSVQRWTSHRIRLGTTRRPLGKPPRLARLTSCLAGCSSGCWASLTS